MAYALAMQAAIDFKKNGELILLVALLYALFTILIQGSILNPILTKCDVKQIGSTDDIGIISEDSTKNCFDRLKERMMRFDHDYFSPLFIKINAYKSKNSFARVNSVGRTSSDKLFYHDERAEER